MTIRKVAIVTGASEDIGAGLVAGYRRRGWAVVAGPRTVRPSPDPDLLQVAGDPAAPAGIVGAALERFGRIDTLVNAVDVAKSFGEHTDYAAVLGAGLAGFVALTQRAIGEMAIRYGGHVVNLIGAAGAPDSGAPAMLAALTGGALTAVTRSLAVEYASRGIRVNAVSVGVIQAPLQPVDVYPGPLPLVGHLGQVSDVVDGVLFLEQAPFITGEILHIDGGTIRHG